MSAVPTEVEWPESIFEHWGQPILQHYGALELADAQPPSLSNAIHPLFTARKWTVSDNDEYESPPPAGAFGPSMNEDDYRLLKPSCRLASHFLSHPSLLPYWHALLFSPRFPVPNREVINSGRGYSAGYASFTRNYNLYTNSYALSTAETRSTLHALVALADMTTLAFGPTEDDDTWAETRRIFNDAAAPAFAGTASSITLNIRLLHALRSTHLTVSERLRLHYFLGIALVHELGHAAHYAHTAMLGAPAADGSYAGSQRVHEAFFENDILAEAGHAWEQLVLNGSQIPFYSSPECKFGTQFEKWPGLQEVPLNMPARRKRKGWTTVYVLLMRFVQAAMTDGHWEEVRRCGAGVVRAPKGLGWRVWLRPRLVVQDGMEGVSWNNSSRGRSADEDGVVWPVEESDGSEDGDDGGDAEDGEDVEWLSDPMEID